MKKLGWVAIAAVTVVFAAGCASAASGGGVTTGGSGGTAGTHPTANGGTGGTHPAATGCASAGTATTVTVYRVASVRAAGHGAPITQRDPAKVRALFRDLCEVVSHRYVPRYAVTCPMDIGAFYSGTFYGGTRTLATFAYRSSGCHSVTVGAPGRQQSSLVLGTAAAAAPHLATDMAAVVGRD